MKISIDNETPNKLWIEVRFPQDLTKKEILNIENKIKIMLADNLPLKHLNYDLDGMVCTWDNKGSRIW